MEPTVVEQATTDTLEQRLIELETLKSRICAEQIAILREADLRQVPLGDGCRSLGEWTAARLDISSDTAKRLVAASRLLADHFELETRWAMGKHRLIGLWRLDAWPQRERLKQNSQCRPVSILLG